MTSDQPDLWVIYGLRVAGTEAIRYVGMTTLGVEKRVRWHHYDAKRKDFPVQRWIRENEGLVAAEVLEVCPEGDKAFLAARETHWIATLRSRDAALLNVADGGLSPSVAHLTEAHKKAISDGLRAGGTRSGWSHTDAARAKMSDSHRGVPLTEEARKTMSDGCRAGVNHPLFGRTMPDHVREALRVANAGRTTSDETRQKMSDSQLGKPKRSAHTRFHATHGLFREECAYCVLDRNNQNEAA